MYIAYESHIRRVADNACIPIDTGNADYAAYLEWIEAGNEAASPPEPTLEERARILLAGVDAHLNSAAKAKNYDSIVTAALRAALPASPFHAEGLIFGNWMDQVYAACYAIMAQVQSGGMPEPTIEELIQMLPPLELPT